MKILIALLLTTLFSSDKENVFFCKNSTSVTYHAKKECRNIKTCSQDVVEVSLEEATDQYKKKACKVCYKEADIFLFPSPVIVPIGGWEE
ncbi:MAG TPA: hypothetical protein VGN63_22755 [Flavisolibacter sp.]|jgi:hypothetical protein|nr:hypothetical protein [Flavisolibacter sp.]